MCERLHLFIISNDTNGTALTYKNTHTTEVSLTTFDDYLPSSLICGNDYRRCNVHVTSNSDETIRVVIFPLNSGIGLASYDHLTPNDTLVYRDKLLLIQEIQSCTFVYFTESQGLLFGYCLDLSDDNMIHALQVVIDYNNLTLSGVQRRNGDEDERLYNIPSLSNFIFFEGMDGCFSDDNSHVVFLDEGFLLDHSFASKDITFDVDSVDDSCSSVSRLQRLGNGCRLAAYCDGRVILFHTLNNQRTVYTEAIYGQVFLCPDLEFVGFRNETLTLYNVNQQPFGNSMSFPFGAILQGECLRSNQGFILFTSLEDGRTILVNFSGSSYHQLGESEHAMLIASKVKGQIAVVNNGSETLLYNLSLTCAQNPVVLPNNFILTNFFSTSTTERCQCPIESATTTVSSMTTLVLSSSVMSTPVLSSSVLPSVAPTPLFSLEMSTPVFSSSVLSSMPPTPSFSSGTPVGKSIS